jgi:hypothetical protein
METQSALANWLILEGFLLSPLLQAPLFACQRLISRIFSGIPDDLYLAAVLNPLIGAAAGALIGYGADEVFGRDQAGLVYILSALVIIILGGSIVATNYRSRYDSRATDPVTGDSWSRDLQYLDSLARLSQRDLLLFEAKAGDLTAQGRKAWEDAVGYSFRAYWASRRRFTKTLVLIAILFGLILAAGQSHMAHTWWYMASASTGFISAFAGLALSWRQERWRKKARADDLMQAASRINQRLKIIPRTRSLSFRERLYVLFFPDSTISPW